MKTRVLVVDDDRLVADTLSLIFNANGYECEARYTAADCLDSVGVFTPELVLCDLSLPGANGVELAAQVSATHPGIHLLLLTAHIHHELEHAIRADTTLPPLRILHKPCRPDDLLREIRALLTPPAGHRVS